MTRRSGLCVAVGGLLLALAPSLEAQSPPAAPDPGAEWQAPDDVRNVPNPIAASPDVLKKGRGLYAQHCAICHGPRGRGDGTAARLHARRAKPPQDLTRADIQARLTDGEIFWKISNGWKRGSQIVMPAFDGDIPSAEDRWRLVLYVRALGQPGP
jgi:mono/diheme cytochrome c family protein